MTGTLKVTPVRATPPPKENNFFIKSNDIVHNLRFLVYTEMIIGINRLYLLKCGQFMQWLGVFHNIVLLALTMFVVIVNLYSDQRGSAYTIFRLTICVEYLVLVCASLFILRKKLNKFFSNIVEFDAKHNVAEQLATRDSTYRIFVWLFLSGTYCLTEYLLLHHYIPYWKTPFLPIWYLTSLAHDCEKLFFITLIRFVLIRLKVLKGHVVKSFGIEDNYLNYDENGKFENLAMKTQLDTSEMHRSYELLHKCSEQLNSVMSFPLFTTFFASGLSTTILLKQIFQSTQSTDADPAVVRAMIIYALCRCLKMTALVVIPCYYSSITGAQVTIIRTMLHNAINTMKLDKIERRKVKAFFQLTQDNKFAYALWGVIRLNMSLPLSYSSLCTTYLIIIIQFSKFID